jgi:hypothetical protein
MCDIFYYDKQLKKIIYIEDWIETCISELSIENEFINILKFEYGEEEQLIAKLGSFNKWNPSFLHPVIYNYSLKNKEIEMIDRITFEENLVSDFSDTKTLNKIYQSLKTCNLIL